MPEGRSSRAAILIAALTFAAGALIYGSTLLLPFAYDDVDLVNQASDVLSGRAALLPHLGQLHGDHLIPVLRLLFLAQGLLFGIGAWPLRLLLLGAHLATALVLAGVGGRYAPGGWAAPATALAYVGTAGLSSQLVWQPIGGSTLIASLAFAAALWAAAMRPRLGGRLSEALALGGIAVGLGCANTLFPLVLGPVLVNERERRRGGPRSPSFLAWSAAGLVLLALAASHAAFLAQAGRGPGLATAGAAWPRALFLAAAAPFRALVPFRSLPTGGLPAGLAPMAVGGVGASLALLAIVWAVRGGPGPRTLVATAGSCALGSTGVVALVALARSSVSFPELYFADRYFHTLALPLALLGGAVAARVGAETAEWSPRARGVLVAVVGLAAAAHIGIQRVAVDRLVDHALYAAHARRFESLVRLMDRLGSATPPRLELPDGAVSFPDVHNRRVTARTLLYFIHGNRSPALVLGDAVISPADAARLDTLLQEWVDGEPPPQPRLSMRDGRMVNLSAAGLVDFSVESAADRLVSGFGERSGGARWMYAVGEMRLPETGPRLRLLLGLPWQAIRLHTPGFAPLVVEASLIGEGGGLLLGRVSVDREGLVPATFDVPADFRNANLGRPVALRLEASRTWRPVDVLPGSADDRELSVLVYRAGFEE